LPPKDGRCDPTSCTSRSTRLDEISLPPAAQSEPFFGPFGPPGRPRDPLPPSSCAKFAGAGAFPPLRPPLRRCAALWLGYAQPQVPKKTPPSAFGGRYIEQRGRRRTAHSKPRKKCHVVIPFRCVPPDMAVVVYYKPIGHLSRAPP
jgi:hypothetical protein